MGAETWAGDPSQAISTVVESALEGESFASFSCFRLQMNRPWYDSPGAEVKLAPLTSTFDWLGGVAFPNGETNRKSKSKIIYALWRFLYRHKKPHKIILLK